MQSLGYEVIVANGRQVKLIARADRKTDRLDAETLALIGGGAAPDVVIGTPRRRSRCSTIGARSTKVRTHARVEDQAGSRDC